MLVPAHATISTACTAGVKVARYFLFNSSVLLRVVTAEENLDTRVLGSDFQNVAHDSPVCPTVITVTLRHCELADVEFHCFVLDLVMSPRSCRSRASDSYSFRYEVEEESVVLQLCNSYCPLSGIMA